MAIGATVLDTEVDSTSGTTAACESVTPTAEALVLFCVWYRNSDANSDPGDPSSVVGGGGQTYDKVASVVHETRRRVAVYRARQASWTAGAITATFAVNVTAIMHVLEFTGVNTSGTNGSGAIVQSVTNTGSATSLTVSLAAFGSADNVSFGFMAHSANEAHTPGTGYTELTDVAGGNSSATEWKIGDDDPDMSWATSSACAGIGIEIKAAAGTTHAAAAALSLSTSLAAAGNLIAAGAIALPLNMTMAAALGLQASAVTALTNTINLSATAEVYKLLQAAFNLSISMSPAMSLQAALTASINLSTTLAAALGATFAAAGAYSFSIALAADAAVYKSAAGDYTLTIAMSPDAYIIGQIASTLDLNITISPVASIVGQIAAALNLSITVEADMQLIKLMHIIAHYAARVDNQAVYEAIIRAIARYESTLYAEGHRESHSIRSIAGYNPAVIGEARWP